MTRAILFTWVVIVLAMIAAVVAVLADFGVVNSVTVNVLASSSWLPLSALAVAVLLSVVMKGYRRSMSGITTPYYKPSGLMRGCLILAVTVGLISYVL